MRFFFSLLLRSKRRSSPVQSLSSQSAMERSDATRPHALNSLYFLARHAALPTCWYFASCFWHRSSGLGAANVRFPLLQGESLSRWTAARSAPRPSRTDPLLLPERLLEHQHHLSKALLLRFQKDLRQRLEQQRKGRRSLSIATFQISASNRALLGRTFLSLPRRFQRRLSETATTFLVKTWRSNCDLSEM